MTVTGTHYKQVGKVSLGSSFQRRKKRVLTFKEDYKGIGRARARYIFRSEITG